jgi:hypothetical protein
MHSSILKIVGVAIAHLSFAYADYGFSIAQEKYCDIKGCSTGTGVAPDGSWSCDTLQNSPAHVWTDDNGTFHVAGNNFCGVRQLDMYSNGANFDVYIAGGDGTKVGYCYPTTAQKASCGGPVFSITDDWNESMYCDLWGPGTSRC